MNREQMSQFVDEVNRTEVGNEKWMNDISIATAFLDD
jgi:hypothetical protein